MLGYFCYSATCKYCTNLIQLLNTHNISNLFEYKCIDGYKLDQLSKLQIRSVPSIILVHKNDMNEKKTEIHESQEAFVWVKNYLTTKRNMQNSESSRKLIQVNNVKNRLLEHLYEYCPNEQSSISDAYALCKEDTNIAMPQSFVSYTNSDKRNPDEIIITIPVDKKHQENKEKIETSMMSKLLTQLKDSRSNQELEIRKVMETNTLDTIKKSIITM